MLELIKNPTVLIILLGGIIVFLSTMANFNNTCLMPSKLSDDSWLDHLKKTLSMSPGKQNMLIRPARANTTIFRYRLYQLMYGIIGLLIYLALLIPSFVEQMQEVILWFSPDSILDVPDIINSEPLVVAAFVIFILPNVPPFRWVDVKIRSVLYERALIPAQQIREMHRLQMADYYPPTEIIKKVRELSIADGFDETDIAYDNEFPTTQSLWTKCVLLVEQIKIWEADGHYKTSFADLKEPEIDVRTVEAVKKLQYSLMSDARDIFSKLRANDGEKSEKLKALEDEFRNSCRELLQKIYALLACVSLQTHYSDRERILKFNRLGFKLKMDLSGPIPNSNDMLILTIILCTLLVLPLAYRLGMIKAIMIGAIMFSAVLTPIILAHFFPKICNQKKETDDKVRQYIPNVRFPVLSALFAAALGFIIFTLGGLFLEATEFCNYTGYERYTNCSYPWGFIHAGIAMILSICMSLGTYPDVQKLTGLKKYKQWGNFKDAIICSLFLLLITVLFVIPQLEALGQTITDTQRYYSIIIRISIIAFVLGFVVPTWYRAHNRIGKGERRENHAVREQFNEELNNKKEGVESLLIRH